VSFCCCRIAVNNGLSVFTPGVVLFLPPKCLSLPVSPDPELKLTPFVRFSMMKYNNAQSVLLYKVKCSTD